MTIKGTDSLCLMLSQIGKSSEDIAKRAVYAGAEIVTDKIRENLETILEDSENSSGALLESLGIAPIKTDNNGNVNTIIGFDGYDENKTEKYPQGRPNQVKARAIESGTSKQKKRPFVRPAIKATKEQAENAMAKAAYERIEIFLK